MAHRSANRTAHVTEAVDALLGRDPERGFRFGGGGSYSSRYDGSGPGGVAKSARRHHDFEPEQGRESAGVAGTGGADCGSATLQLARGALLPSPRGGAARSHSGRDTAGSSRTPVQRPSDRHIIGPARLLGRSAATQTGTVGAPARSPARPPQPCSARRSRSTVISGGAPRRRGGPVVPSPGLM